MPLPNLLPAGAKPRGSDFNALRAQLEAQRITGVAGLIGGAFSGGSALAALGLPPVPRRIVRKEMPFQVNLTDSSTTAPKAAISTFSRLYASIGGSSISITDLTTEFNLASNTHVWLQCTVSAYAVSAASIQTGTSWPTLIVTSGSPAVQTQFNVPIGKVIASVPLAPGFKFVLSSTEYHFEQLLFSHLLVEVRASSSATIAIYAFPWSGS